MQRSICAFAALAATALACTPLTRASYAQPLPAVDLDHLTSTTRSQAVHPDALQSIVITPADWTAMHQPASTTRTEAVCDVPAAMVDPTALRSIAATAAELTQKMVPTPKPSALLGLRSLAVTCDAEHAVVMVNGRPFSAEQIYAAERTDVDGTRVLLVEAMARATGSLLFVAATFDGPAATGKPTESGYAVANVTEFLTSDDDVLIVPAERSPTFEMYISNKQKTPESGVYLTGPSDVDDGALHIHAARFTVTN